MIKNYVMLITGLFIASWANAQIVNIPDANFKNALVNTICADLDNNNITDSDVDTNNNGEIEVAEALAVYGLFNSSGGNPPLRMQADPFQNMPTNISDVTGIEAFQNLKRLNLNSNLLTSLDVSMLPALMVLQCQSNNLLSLTLGNLANLNVVNCSGNDLTSLDLSGVPNLITLNCIENDLTTLDLANVPALVRLECRNNPTPVLDLSDLPSLTYLNCSYNGMTALDLSGNPALMNLLCFGNDLSALDVSQNTNLIYLGCTDNNIATLDVSNLSALQNLECGLNQLTSITFANNDSLSKIYCSYNLLETLDLSGTPVIQAHVANNPNLVQLNLKNGVISPVEYQEMPAPPMVSFDFTNTPNLEFICGDADELPVINELLNGQVASVSSYCTFTPGGDYNTISGIVNLNCAGENIAMQNLAISVSDQNQSGVTFTSATGNFSVFTGMGTFTVQPVFENPAYFNATPANVTFNSLNQNFIANFCVTASGIHPDLKITILALTPARPGFDSDYKIILENNGTETQSGVVNFSYDNMILDFISADPAATAASGAVSWNFSQLMPFEQREYLLTLNLNAPTETPAVNNGDVLDFIANAEAGADETPSDNLATLVQTVVGSFDPNDKAVSKTQITFGQTGEYLEYLIRFQNTGTFAAENVVISDLLSANLDHATPQLISASHPAEVHLQENRLEVVFENIDLPPSVENEPESHGYVAFRIKPLATLQDSDLIENTADIHFDYNFPIVTNTVTTLVVPQLSVSDPARNEISIYPNPASAAFMISSEENNTVDSVTIFNSLGQIVKSVRNPEGIVPISELSSATYFVEITAGATKIVKKLIKI